MLRNEKPRTPKSFGAYDIRTVGTGFRRVAGLQCQIEEAGSDVRCVDANHDHVVRAVTPDTENLVRFSNS
jgi:hypothetical protein